MIARFDMPSFLLVSFDRKRYLQAFAHTRIIVAIVLAAAVSLACLVIAYRLRGANLRSIFSTTSAVGGAIPSSGFQVKQPPSKGNNVNSTRETITPITQNEKTKPNEAIKKVAEDLLSKKKYIEALFKFQEAYDLDINDINAKEGCLSAIKGHLDSLRKSAHDLDSQGKYADANTQHQKILAIAKLIGVQTDDFFVGEDQQNKDKMASMLNKVENPDKSSAITQVSPSAGTNFIFTPTISQKGDDPIAGQIQASNIGTDYNSTPGVGVFNPPSSVTPNRFDGNQIPLADETLGDAPSNLTTSTPVKINPPTLSVNDSNIESLQAEPPAPPPAPPPPGLDFNQIKNNRAHNSDTDKGELEEQSNNIIENVNRDQGSTSIKNLTPDKHPIFSPNVRKQILGRRVLESSGENDDSSD